jgi:glutamate synthase (NADPH/NADH) small chain
MTIREPPPAVDRKARLQVPPQPLPKQDPAERVRNWREVSLPLSPEIAMVEAYRCIQCPAAPCVRACPVHNDIPGALWRLEQGDFLGAAAVFRETSNMPDVCGRICPQERLCEGHCVVGKNNLPVAIGRLEAFAVDQHRAAGDPSPPRPAAPTGRRVAVVGAGPAGLAAAEDLRLRGHAVTILDAWPRPGGLLLYGIPSFKLEKGLVHALIARLEGLGVDFRPGVRVGDAAALNELRTAFDAVLLAHGATISARLDLPGEDLPGVYQATEFLVRANLDESLLPAGMTPLRHAGRRVVVIGGGDTSIDCVRTAVRLGAEEVTLVYRRGEAEMRCREEERHYAQEEGVSFQFQTVPLMFLAGPDGRLSGLRCVRTVLGEPDESGRQSFLPVRGSNFVLEADSAVVAIGYRVEADFLSDCGVAVDSAGRIAVDAETMATSVPGVYSAGDSVNGADLVVTAVAGGRRAAAAIDRALARVAA